MDTATARPWSIDTESEDIVSANCVIAGMCGLPGEKEESDANAALIVRAVNCHDALVEALEGVDKILYHYLDEVHPLRVKIEAALRAARGEV